MGGNQPSTRRSGRRRFERRENPGPTGSASYDCAGILR